MDKNFAEFLSALRSPNVNACEAGVDWCTKLSDKTLNHLVQEFKAQGMPQSWAYFVLVHGIDYISQEVKESFIDLVNNPITAFHILRRVHSKLSLKERKILYSKFSGRLPDIEAKYQDLWNA